MKRLGTYAAYIGSQTAVSASHCDAYDLGTGDFSVSFLVAPDTAGMVIGCVKDRQRETKNKAGWYVEIQKGNKLRFYTGNGIRYAAATSAAVPVLGSGCSCFITCVRKAGHLSILLDEQELPCSYDGFREEAIDVTVGTDLYFGGLETQYEGSFRGVLQCVTLWSKAVDLEDLSYAHSGILPPDGSHLIGWWTLDGELSDKSPSFNPISNARNLAFVEAYDTLWTEEKGYLYWCVAEGTPALPLRPKTADRAVDAAPMDAILSRRELYARERNGLNSGGCEQLKRTFTVPVRANGAIMGTINSGSELPEYPEGVTLNVFTPTGVSVATLPCTDKQWVVTHNGNVWQFLIVGPEQGEWKVELSAGEGLSFDLDCQFIPEGADRDDLAAAARRIYGQYDTAQITNGVIPETFVLKPFARIAAQVRLDSGADRRQNSTLMVFVVVAALGLIVGIVAEQIKDSVLDPAAGQLKWLPESELYYYYNMTKGCYDSLIDKSTFTLYHFINTQFGGENAPTDPGEFITRYDLKELGVESLHLDLGGEGCFAFGGAVFGWIGAININTQNVNSQYKDMHIPYLVRLANWTNCPFPFESNSVGRITAQSIPGFTAKEQTEIVRCLRKEAGAQINVWTLPEFLKNFALDKITAALNKELQRSKYKAVYVEKEPDNETDFLDYDTDFYRYTVKIVKK